MRLQSRVAHLQSFLYNRIWSCMQMTVSSALRQPLQTARRLGLVSTVFLFPGQSCGAQTVEVA